jgi:hypothetical protein
VKEKERKAKEREKGKAKAAGASVGASKVSKGVICMSYYFPQCGFFS